MIKLFSQSATSFNNNGIGSLHPIKHTVVEELNGMYEGYMQIPVDSEHFSDIAMRSIIYCKPNPHSDPQPFRVYRMTKPINGIVGVYSYHRSYDLSGAVVTPYTAADVGTALSGLVSHSLQQHGFSFNTDKTTAGTFSVKVPASVRSLLGGQAGSILDVFGGEYMFNDTTITLLNRRGSDRGVSVKYGRNMKNLEQDENCANCCTGVVPYWASDEETVYGSVVNASGTYPYTKIIPLNLTDKFDEKPTTAQLESAAAQYMSSNSVGVPEVSWKVEFLPLSKTLEYADIAALEEVYLGDTVSVAFEKLGVTASARVVETTYDVLTDQYESVTLGRVKQNLSQTITKQNNSIKAQKEELYRELSKVPKQESIERIVNTLGNKITGAEGGSVRLIDTDGDGEPNELYIADSPNPSLAQKVWRFNYEGWAVSQTGYEGPFTMGATIEDGFLADFITAANLKAGTIQSEDGKTFYLNLTEGILQMDAKSIALNGNQFGDFISVTYDEEDRPVLQLGWAGNSILLRLLNDRISFYDMNSNPPTELAYWNNNSFRLKTLQSFQLGKMKMVAQENGSVSFVKGDN